MFELPNDYHVCEESFCQKFEKKESCLSYCEDDSENYFYDDIIDYDSEEVISTEEAYQLFLENEAETSPPGFFPS